LTPVLPVTASPLAALGYPWLTGYLSTDNVILLGIALSSSVLLVLITTQFVPAIAAFADPHLKRADVFAKLYTGSALCAPLNHKPRRVGGACTILGGIAFVTLALVNILQRAADNVSIQESVVALTDARFATSRSLPVFSAAPWGAGIQVRIFASGDGAQCASPLRSPSNAGWKLRATTLCGGSGASQLVFSCADCTTAESELTLDVALHYSCQSLLIEAGAIDGLGVVTSFAIPAAKTAGSSGTLLSSITWSLPTLLSVVNSTVSQYTSARGYTITSGAYAITPQSLPTAVGGGLAIIPNSAAVSIKISFPLNTFYSTTLLSEKQSVASLLSSLIGLAGIFGLFGSLLAASDFSAACLRSSAACARFVPGKRGRSFASSGPAVVEEKREPGQRFGSTVNPLAMQKSTARTDGCVDLNTTTTNEVLRWYKRNDEIDTWFVSSAGESVWVLPFGAQLSAE
jgi:hypothetical protein